MAHTKQKLWQSSIKLGLHYIGKVQTRYGSFLSYTKEGLENVKGAGTIEIERETSFYTSLVLSSLATTKSAIIDDKSYHEQVAHIGIIAKKGVHFLMTEKQPSWSFNYWKHGTIEDTTLHCPDDLDATMCALSAISEHAPTHIDERALAVIGELLISTETAPGGPYRTWIVDPHSLAIWKDVDVVVNVNIMRFLSKKGVHLPPLFAFIQKHLDDANYASKYYHSPFALFYFLADCYRNQISHLSEDEAVVHLSNIRSTILSYKKSNGSFGSVLETALAIAALTKLGTAKDDLKKSIDWLLKKQNKNGSWDSCRFFIEEVRGHIYWYSGAAAFTTAIAIEAISLYSCEQNEEATLADKQAAAVIQLTEQVLVSKDHAFPAQMRNESLSALKRFTNKDITHEVSLLPYFFNNSLKAKYRLAGHDDIIKKLGAANIFGWLGYTITDNIIDGDTHSIQELPIASLALRKMNTLFTTAINSLHKKTNVGLKTEIENVLSRILVHIEATTLWEYTSTKLLSGHAGHNEINTNESGTVFKVPTIFPSYGNHHILAEKSLGHALGPLIIASVTCSKKQLDLIETFFAHYLIARQINDDAHDWLDDLRHGYMNSVSVPVLKVFIKQNTTDILNLEKDTKLLRFIFWNEVIDSICKRITDNTKAARAALKQLDIIEKPNYLLSLIERIERSAEQALTDRDKAIRLVDEYASLQQVK